MTQITPEPVYRIEVYDPTPTLLYTFGNTSSDIAKPILWQTKDVLTDGVGYFCFVVPSQTGSTYQFNDIDLFDIVKFKHGYSTLPANYQFIGRVYDISTPLSIDQGYVRVISGLSQGEVLLRRIKSNKRWQTPTMTGDIAFQVANDLGIGDPWDIDAQISTPTITCESETYFDLLRRISDLYVSGTTIKFDFHVDVDNHLHWKERPLRDSGVPVFTVGKNILDYKVTRSLSPVRNNITVYGAAEKPLPSDKDLWTEEITNWAASAGVVDVNNVAPAVGTWYIRGWTGAAAAVSTFKRDFDRISTRNINTLYFWHSVGANCTAAQVRLYAPSSSYFWHDLSTASAGWVWYEHALGPDQEYSATANPNGVWRIQGTPNWWDIQGIEFSHTFSANDRYAGVDGLYFNPDRWSDTTFNIVSINNYGQHDLEVTDNTLHSDNECEQRSETLLYQLKDPVIQIDVTTYGDNNILVGDRVVMSIPAENIVAQEYDIFAVEHNWSAQGYRSKATMVNSADKREPVETSLDRVVANLKVQVRRISTDFLRVG